MPRVRKQDFDQLVLYGRCVDSDPPTPMPPRIYPTCCKRCARYVAARWWRHRDGTVTHVHYNPCGEVLAMRRHDAGWNFPGVPAEVGSQPCEPA